MTTEQIVFRSCLALWAVAMLFATDQMGAGQARTTDKDVQAKALPVPAPTNAARPDVVASGTPVKPGDSLTAIAAPLTASDLAALFSRCVTSALDEEGPDSPAFTYTDPHTERKLAIFCDAQRPVKVVNLERRYVQ